MTGTVTRLRPDRDTGRAMSWAEARLTAHRLPVPLSTEVVPLQDGIGRTLGLPVRATTTLPGFDNAAMDGYAVRGDGPWRLVGRMLAGDPPPVALADGEAIEISTGAPVPDRTDRVVEYEVATCHDNVVSAMASERRHVRRRGESVRAGQQILDAGHRLTPAAIGLAASVGTDRVTVRARTRLRLLVTGEEVVTHGCPPPGTVRDAIGPVITALAPTWGAHPDIRCEQVPDRPADALTAALTENGDAHITVVSGSSSVGAADGLHDALHAIGATVHVDGVACRPGHPQILAQVGDRWIVGLPGNPFAALVAAYTLLSPLLAGLAARVMSALPTALLHGEVRPDPANTRLVPVRWQPDGVHVIDGARPGYLGPAAYADALAVVPPAGHTALVGEAVQLLPLTTAG